MKFFYNIKDGLNDIKNMIFEQNYRPFIRPAVAVLVFGILVSILNNRATTNVLEVQRKVDAQRAEVENEVEYKNAKATYEKLLKELPPFEKKNEWLLSQMISIFSKLNIEATRTGKHVLAEDGIFTLSSVNVEAEVSYDQLGKVVEAIESNPNFMRISDLTVSRADGSLGKIQVSMKIHTVFVEEAPAAKEVKI